MRYSRFFPLAVILVLALAFSWRLMQMNTPTETSSYRDVMLGKAMPALELPMLEDEQQTFSTNALLGKPYLLNIFASWCAACRLEHDVLQRLAESQALPLYGIAWKDRPENTRNWLLQMGNIYQAVGVDLKGTAALELGLTGAPETYLVAPDGTIAAIYRGALSDSVAEKRFAPAIAAIREQQENGI